uniref:Protein quaking putative nuclear localisation signal domain-containing protein n=1 Tax=Knipowitschia caucasica TaxID=637954 RepID=A0AAV2JID5_KNICA
MNEGRVMSHHVCQTPALGEIIPPQSSSDLLSPPQTSSVLLSPPQTSSVLLSPPQTSSVLLSPPQSSSVPPQSLVSPSSVPPRSLLGPSSVPPQSLVGLSSVPPQSLVGPSSVPPRSLLSPSSVPRRSLVGPSSVPPRSLLGPSSAPPRPLLGPSSAPPRPLLGPSSVPPRSLLGSSSAEGEDNLKKMQLMELAILNGTYRDNNIKAPAAAVAQGPRLIAGPTGQVLPPSMRPPTPGGAPIMNLIRPQVAAMLPNGTPTLVPPSPDGGLIYTSPYDYPYTLAPTSLLEYPMDHTGVLGKRAWGGMASFSPPSEAGLMYSAVGALDPAALSHSQDFFKGAMATKVRRHDTRVHPYQRIVTADRAATGN